MGYELKQLMKMYGVSTPTMAPAPQMPGAAPTAVTELVKPELRAQPVAPVKPGRKASAEEKAAYQAARSTYNADLKAWNADKKTYDAAMKTYNTALPKYQEDLAKYEKDKAAFDETMRKYGLDKAQYDQYAQDYQNRLANTNLYNQAQFSTTGANVPPITTFSDAQKAAVGMMPATDQVGGPQDFANIGQGGLNQQIQSYMSTSPSAPDMNAFMTRYGLTDYDMRNAMGTGTTYGAPQWTDMLKPPVFASAMPTTPVNPGGTTAPGTVNTGTTQSGGVGRDRDSGDRVINRTPSGTGTGTFFGYTGLRDMFDGGGPGQSGQRGGYTGLRDMFDGGGPGRSRAKAAGGYIQNYAQGGTVRGYAPGGIISGGAGDDVLMGRPAGDMLTPAPMVEDTQDASAVLEAMLNRYAPQTVTREQIAAASERRAAEQKAFEDILRSQLQNTGGDQMSKAEKYFRLAAAFGAPTKTGHFSENLALVGETMAEELAAKAQREREAREKKLGVELEIQKMRMGTAGEEYDALRGLQSEEAKYRRDVANELLKEQIASGKAGYTQVTGAELGLTGEDAGKMFNVSPEGQVTAIGGAGTTVNVGGGSQDKLDEEFAKLDAKSLAEVSTTGMQAIRNIGRIDHLETVLADSPQGMEGAAKLFAGEFGIDTEGLDSVQTAQAVINSLVPEQRAPGSGPMSDADLALFKQSLPRIINQPGGNKMIIDTLRAIAQYDAEGAAIVQKFRAKEIDSVKAFELLQARENPLANFRVPGGTEGGGGGSRIRTWNPETKELE